MKFKYLNFTNIQILIVLLALYSCKKNEQIKEVDPTETNVPIENGSIENPYLIECLADLRWLSETDSIWDKHFLQTADIDASATDTFKIEGNDTLGFSPIGRYVNSKYIITYFTGVYDGGNHFIDDIFINRGDKNLAGLFGALDSAEIKNISLINCDIKGNDFVGGLVGVNRHSIVEHCSVRGKIEGYREVGGIVGVNYGEIKNCKVTGAVSGSDQLGILVGRNYDLIEKCYSTGVVKGFWDIGGLVGMNQGNILSCYSTGQATSSGAVVGGLVGSNHSIIRDSYATGMVVDDAQSVGGLCGFNNGEIYNTYATGKVIGTLESTGGLVGCNYKLIMNSYFDLPLSAQSVGIGVDERDQTVVAVDSKEFNNILTYFTNWDFDTIWILGSTDDDKFVRPRLRWQDDIK